MFAISAVTGEGIDELLRALMRHIEESRNSLANDSDVSAAEAELDTEIAADILRQSLARRPQRPSEHAVVDDDEHDEDDGVEVIYRAE